MPFTKHTDMSDEHVAKMVQWRKIVATAWKDEAFRKKLVADPNKVLADNGIRAKAGHSYKVVEDTEQVRHLVLPPKPSGDLNVEEMRDQADPGF